MRVLVTGAQGCIGAWIVKLLVDRGIDVLIYDLDANPSRLALITSPADAAKIPVETGRIEDTARVKSVVKDGGITHIVHLAAVLMPYCQANPVQGGLIDVIGTLNVFEAARDAGRPVRIAYASSSAVVGPDDFYGGRKVSEADPLKPATHYGVFKQANEGNARAFYSSDGISSVGLRPWAVYGPGRDGGLTAAPTFAMKAAVLEKPFQIRISGFMDLQYVEDVAETFIRCLLADLAGAHVFNLAGEIIRMEDFILALDRERPGSGALLTTGGPEVPVSYKLDDSQLRATVPGIPRTSLADGIRKTVGLFEKLQREGRLTPDLG
jgi:nucleoside-diphosphate-sugar epimerase